MLRTLDDDEDEFQHGQVQFTYGRNESIVVLVLFPLAKLILLASFHQRVLGEHQFTDSQIRAGKVARGQKSSPDIITSSFLS